MSIRDADVPSQAAGDPIELATGRSRRVARRIGMLGPAFVAAVAYVDPGNVAANLQAGTKYGYLLVWVLVIAVAAAGVVQFLSAKLGLATGQSLPELVGHRLGRSSRIAYWLQAEAVAMATDLAEVVGGAIALYLLFDLPLLVGGLICRCRLAGSPARAESPRPAHLRTDDHRVSADHRGRIPGRPVRVAAVRRRCCVPV